VAAETGNEISAARNIAPLRARQLIEENAEKALNKLDAVKPYDPGRPAEIEVEFMSPNEVAKYRGRQGVEITGPESLVVRAADWWSAWRALYLEPKLAS